MRTGDEDRKERQVGLQERRSAIFEALLEHGGVGSVLDAGSRVLGNPVFIMDMAWNVVEKSDSSDFGEAFWEDFFSAGEAGDAIDQLDRAGVYAKLLASDEPVFGEISSYDNRFLGTRIRDRKDVVGMICLCEERPIADEDADLLVDLARAIALEMVYQGETAARHNPLGSFVQGLIAGDLDPKGVSARAKMLGVQPLPSMCALLLEFPPLETRVPLYLTRSRLAENVDNVLCAIVDESIVMAIDASRVDDSDLESVLRCCSGKGVRIGLSSPFASLSDFGRAFGQAVSALDLHTRLGKPGTVCRYGEVYLYHFLQTAARSQDLSGFYDPAVMAMRAYDDEHGTDYSQVVEAYLDAGRSASGCAKRLFSHRNTVHYRLKRAQRLFQIDLFDEDRCFSLELTFRILKVVG